MSEQVEFRILGVLEAAVGRRPVRPPGGRSRLVLAALLLDAGRVVPVSRLTAAVWGHDPPSSARTQLAICVSGLRRAVRTAGGGDGWLQTAGSGYRVRADAVRLDAAAAGAALAEGRRAAAAGRAEHAAAVLGRALGLWRGPVLAGLDGEVVAAGARRWEELRLTVAEEFADAELSLGRHRELADDLWPLVLENPFNERLRGQLMTALALAGRRCDALRVYRDGRRLALDELGVEPARPLRDLHETIMSDAPPPATRSRPEPGTTRITVTLPDDHVARLRNLTDDVPSFIAHTVAQTLARPAAQTLAHPAAQTLAQPAAQLAAHPAVQPAVQPAAQTLAQPAGPSAGQPGARPAARPIAHRTVADGCVDVRPGHGGA